MGRSMLKMAKINRKMVVWALFIIGALILFNQPEDSALKGAQADISSAQIHRSFSASTVKVGTTFTNTYTASSYGAGSWGVLISDTSSGGCSPASINKGFLGPDQLSATSTITAPSTAGTCTFTGTYAFGSSTDKAINGPSTVNVCQDECAAGQTGCFSSTTKWTCDTSSTCGVKINIACQSFETCSAGACVPSCSQTLKPNALNSIVARSINPTAAN